MILIKKKQLIRKNKPGPNFKVVSSSVTYTHNVDFSIRD